MKIVYCLNSIRYLGGIQRVTIQKVNALAEIEGNEIFVAVSDNKGGVLVEPLSAKVHLVDLDINYYSDDWKSRWNVIKGVIVKRRLHKKRLATLLEEIQPDIVVSVGQSEKNFLPEIKGKWKTVREFHFLKDYRRRQAKGLFAKAMAYIGDFYDFQIKIKAYDRIVVLTEEDLQTNWKGYDNVSVIPNACTADGTEVSQLNNSRIISVGRLEYQKNFSSLIRSFAKISNKFPNWTLEIVGEGSQRKLLTDLIAELGLQERVMLSGYSDNVPEKMRNSTIFAMTSVFEGFGMVIVEAMACGLPVVSYACPCGPKDIINDGIDGFLVDVDDEEALSNRIAQLIMDEELRKKISVNALVRYKDYSMKNISDMWMKLFHSIIS